MTEHDTIREAARKVVEYRMEIIQTLAKRPRPEKVEALLRATEAIELLQTLQGVPDC